MMTKPIGLLPASNAYSFEPSFEDGRTLPPETGACTKGTEPKNLCEEHFATSPIMMMGVPFDHVDTSQTLNRIDDMIASGRSHQIATANVDFLTLAQSDTELHQILTESDLVLCDGMPLVWMSRLLGNPLPERVAGSELVPKLLERAAKKGHRVFILGGSQDSLAGAKRRIKKEWPNLPLVGTYSPPFAPLEKMDNDFICQCIRKARPDILLVAFGCPKQEKWLHRNLAATGVPVGIGVGATIDFLAGTVRQAPRWMRASSLEWTWRIMQDPKRLFPRYLKDTLVAGPALFRQLWRMQGRGILIKSRSKGTLTNSSPENRATSGIHPLTLPERFDAKCLGEVDSASFSEDESSNWQLIDASSNRFIDSTAIGWLLRRSKTIHRRGGMLVLVRPSRALQNSLETMKITEHFKIVSSVREARKLVASLQS